jgi:hypothetical protein
MGRNGRHAAGRWWAVSRASKTSQRRQMRWNRRWFGMVYVNGRWQPPPQTPLKLDQRAELMTLTNVSFIMPKVSVMAYRRRGAIAHLVDDGGWGIR